MRRLRLFSSLLYERYRSMQRILFICHGNICRSTMAESVFTELVRRAGREAEFVIDSAATSTEEIGNPPHHGTVAKLREVGVPVVAHRARQVRRAEYGNWDHIVYMDAENARGLHRIFGDDPDGKITRLLDWTERPGRRGRSLVHRQLRCHLPRRARRLHRCARAAVGKRGRRPRLRRETSVGNLPHEK